MKKAVYKGKDIDEIKNLLDDFQQVEVRGKVSRNKNTIKEWWRQLQDDGFDVGLRANTFYHKTDNHCV